MAKKDLVDKVVKAQVARLAHNPLMASLRDNDKRNLFNTTARSFFHKTGFPLFDYYFGSVINVHDETGQIIRQEPRVGQADGTFNMIVGNTGTGKALPDSTMVPTPSGKRPMGSLKIGDLVFDENGEPTKILGVYPQGEKQVWKVTTEHGRVARCSADHLWSYSYRQPKLETGIFRATDTTEEMARLLLGKQKRLPRLPRAKAVRYPFIPVPVPPYLLGLVFGSSAEDRETWLKVINGEPLPGTNRSKKLERKFVRPFDICRERFDRICTLAPGAWSEKLTELVAGNRIPDNYLINSVEVRWQLLRGLIDAGASIRRVDSRRYRLPFVSFASEDPDYLVDICHLARSLGLEPKLTLGDVLHPDRHKLTIKGGFDLDIIRAFPTITPIVEAIESLEIENSESAGYHHDDDDGWEKVITVEPTSDRESMTCIMVENPSGLFLTEDYIVTHNTTLAVQIAANIIRPYEQGLVLHYDFEQRFDISRAENLTRLPIWEFEEGGRYILQQGEMSLEDAQEAIVKLYAAKIQNKAELMVNTGKPDEFGKDLIILPPTVVIFDSVSNIIPDGFSVNNAKDMAEVEKLRGNMAGARDAKTIRGFLRDISPLLKSGSITVYAINHINSNVQISMFGGPQKQMNFLKQDESIPGGKALFYNSYNLPKLISKPSDDFTEATDGFAGHMVMIEPVKSSSNQSGNNSKGISFDMVFTYKNGFDSLRSLILYGKEKGLIEGTKPRLKFVGDPSFTFAWKELDREKETKPIWDSIKKFILPELESHLSFVEPVAFDERTMDY